MCIDFHIALLFQLCITFRSMEGQVFAIYIGKKSIGSAQSARCARQHMYSIFV